MTANQSRPPRRRRPIHPVYAVTSLIAGAALVTASVVLIATGAGSDADQPGPHPAAPAPSLSTASPAAAGTEAASPGTSTPGGQAGAGSLRPGGTSSNRFWPDPADAWAVVPPECAQLALLPGPESGALHFVDGAAASPAGAGRVRIETVHDVSPAQSAATAVVLSCVAETGETQQSVAIYNGAGELATGIELWAGWGRTMLQAEVPVVRFSKVETIGNELHLTVQDVRAAPLPGALAGTPVEATIVLWWGGERYEYQTTRYQSAAGMWEHPQAWQLQEFYDALAAGNDAAAAAHTSPENMKAVQTGCLGACSDGVSNYRASIFPPGGVVEECVLIGELGVPLPEVDGAPRKLPLEVSGEAGDFFCGIRRPGQELEPDGAMTYAQWLIVRSAQGEGYYVTQFGRAFS
ncbi:hypothetical protein ABYF34_07270 [Buchananella felis]|uniref:hypothetical protein n=1 Tax=Buchananella felis TaxID=3231492 RepID=UPI0035293422